MKTKSVWRHGGYVPLPQNLQLKLETADGGRFLFERTSLETEAARLETVGGDRFPSICWKHKQQTLSTFCTEFFICGQTECNENK